MTHLWLRAESRANETRCALTPEGAAGLLAKGFHITVEATDDRVFDTEAYRQAGCDVAPAGSWPDAPQQALILGLKELPSGDSPLTHRHIMFGHAFKGQHSGQALLRRFREGGGTLLDLEYLTDADGRRVAAFGYWAGFAGAAVTLQAWAAQKQGGICGPVTSFPDKDAMVADLRARMEATGAAAPSALVVGARGRVGRGVVDLCAACGVTCTQWDMAETASGGPFPEILAHDLFFNCVLATETTPVFVPSEARSAARRLKVIGDIACDPDSDYNPVPLYSAATSWSAPVSRVAEAPPLDVMAIDNLPSLLPLESSEDFAGQLLPHLEALGRADAPVWQRAEALFRQHVAALDP